MPSLIKSPLVSKRRITYDLVHGFVKKVVLKNKSENMELNTSV